jgi:hypothetical protein
MASAPSPYGPSDAPAIHLVNNIKQHTGKAPVPSLSHSDQQLTHAQLLGDTLSKDDPEMYNILKRVSPPAALPHPAASQIHQI